MYLSDIEAKELICSIGKKMYEKQYIFAHDGNITIRVGENAVIATPTGVCKGELSSEMLLKVDLDGNVLEGPSKPTSEIFLHLNAFKQDTKIQSCCHAHSTYLTALACAGIELDYPTTPANVCGVGRIPVIPYCCPGTRELAESIIPYVKNYFVVNLANHGSVAWGYTPIEAFHRIENAENAAKLAILLKYTIGRLRPLTKKQINDVAELNGLHIPQQAHVSAPEQSNNDEPGVGLSRL